jgi:hypothetical protein
MASPRAEPAQSAEHVIYATGKRFRSWRMLL